MPPGCLPVKSNISDQSITADLNLHYVFWTLLRVGLCWVRWRTGRRPTFCFVSRLQAVRSLLLALGSAASSDLLAQSQDEDSPCGVISVTELPLNCHILAGAQLSGSGKWSKPNSEAVPTPTEPAGEGKHVITRMLRVHVLMPPPSLTPRPGKRCFSTGREGITDTCWVFLVQIFICEIQKFRKMLKRCIYLPLTIHIFLLLCFCSNWVFVYIQARLDWVCLHSDIRMKVQLYWESSINYRAVVSVERKKKKSIFHYVFRWLPVLRWDELKKFKIHFSSRYRQVGGKPTYDSNNKGCSQVS